MSLQARIDSMLAAIAPGYAVKRVRARRTLQRLYEAGSPSFQHERPLQGDLSADAVVDTARGNIRAWARHLDENYDVIIGVLDDLVDNIVGTTGLQFEPMIRDRGGRLHAPTNQAARRLWADFWKFPEVSRTMTGREVERLVARTWLRDGEILTDHVEGNVRGLMHATEVPYSIQLIEPDFLPWDLFVDTAGANRIVHGVEKNRWRQPVAYYLYREHPGDSAVSALSLDLASLDRIPASRITHLKLTKRLHQTRGISILHGVIFRADDLQDIDRSERMAVRVASALTAVITKDDNVEELGETIDTEIGDRSWYFQPGMVADNLRPGEDVRVIGSDRPNANLIDFRADQIRAIASGTGTKYSSVSKRFDKAYSAQRQELVESEPGYERVRGPFYERWAGEIWRRHLLSAVTAGVLRIPQVVDPRTVFDVGIRRGGGIPWIDPLKEIEADVMAIDNQLSSRREIIRKRGLDPEQVDAEIEADPVKPQKPAPAATAASGAA